MSGDDKSLSERVEHAVEGVLRFALRLGSSCWLIFRHPLGWPATLTADDPDDRRFVLPLTFLVFGGFIFTLTISVYPFGLLNLPDLLFFDQEISTVLRDRLDEAFSLTGLLTAAFPVFLTVTALAGLAGLAIRDPEARAGFTALNHYAFGYQALLLFCPLFALLALDVAVAVVNGPYAEPTVDSAVFHQIANAIYIVSLVVLVSALLVPSIALFRWQFTRLRKVRSAWNLALLALAVPYALSVLLVMSLAASFPAQFSLGLEEPEPSVGLDFLGDPVLTLEGGTDGGFRASVAVLLVVRNETGSSLVAYARQVSVRLVREIGGAEDDVWHDRGDLTLSREGRPVSVLNVAPKTADVLELRAGFDLTHQTVEALRAKADGDPATNTTVYLFGADLDIEGDDTTRLVALDVSDAVAGLP